MSTAELYIYRAQCVNVVDGDTADLFCDDGRRRYSLERYRLYGVDTPEMRDPDPAKRQKALDAKQFLVQQLGPAPADTKRWPLIVKTYKADSFGRWLADIWIADTGVSVNGELVNRGFAVGYRR